MTSMFCSFAFLDSMAGQQDVHQTGDHNSDPKYPSGGQEREDQREIAHHLRGNDPCGDSQGRYDRKHRKIRPRASRFLKGLDKTHAGPSHTLAFMDSGLM